MMSCACLIVLGALVGASAPETKDPFVVQPFHFPAATTKLIPADLDGDGLRDLVCVTPGKFSVYRQRSTGFDFSKAATLELTTDAVGWTIVDVANTGRDSITALVEGLEVRTWPFDPESETFGEGIVLASELGAVVPGGFYPLSFARDVDGDHDVDLVIPGNGVFHVHIRQDDGTFERRLSVVAEMNVQQRLEPDGDLKARIGQTLSIPLFSIRDVNGDGRIDLRSETEDRLEVFLANEAGFPGRTPSFTLDIGAIRDRVGPAHGDDFDTSNLMAPATRVVQVESKDVDGDAIDDLVILHAGDVDLYRGKKTGIDTSKIDQRLKTSGNVMGFAVEDEDLDGKQDLWLVRAEDVSLADAMLWLVTPGSFKIDFLVYRFETERFAKRPSRRIGLTLRFPPILAFIKEMQEVDISVVQAGDVTAETADLTGSGARQDIVVLENAVLRAYHGKVQKAASLPATGGLLSGVLRITDYSPDVDDYTIDLDKMIDLIPTPGKDLVELVEGSEPDVEIPLPGASEHPGVSLIDLNRDGSDDLLVIYDVDDDGLRGAIVLSRRE